MLAFLFPGGSRWDLCPTDPLYSSCLQTISFNNIQAAVYRGASILAQTCIVWVRQAFPGLVRVMLEKPKSFR